MARRETVLVVMAELPGDGVMPRYIKTGLGGGSLADARKAVTDFGEDGLHYLCVRVVDEFTVQHEVIKKVSLLGSNADNSPEAGEKEE